VLGQPRILVEAQRRLLSGYASAGQQLRPFGDELLVPLGV